MQPDGAEPERDDAGAVRGDGGVVVRDPEPAGRVALPVRQLRQVDRPAGVVESSLQPRGVVAHRSGPSERDTGGDARRPRCTDASSQDQRPAVALKDIVVDRDLSLPVVLSTCDDDPGSPRRGSRSCIAHDSVAGDVDPRRQHGASVHRGEVEEDPGAGVARDEVLPDLNVEGRLAPICDPDV